MRLKRNFVGEHIKNVMLEAQQQAEIHGEDVEFDFNDIRVIVGPKTNLDHLMRDYNHSFIMEWKQIGPNPDFEYDHDTEIELRKRQLARAEKAKKNHEELLALEKIAKEKVEKIISGEILKIKDDLKDDYNDFVEKNSQDGYSRAVVDYAEYWAKLMQVELKNGKTVIDCADSTQKHLGYMGITGFMYGCAVQTLAQFWEQGEELRKWHNKQYGVSEEQKGTVNPAILTIESK